ncbi:hypothetical protein PT974_00742 [Cladobotryum mycophilum]|uniref:Uncharacterized protein n=1 Tax=Cladobotryum mycophilum TaxID=491253 RepID=A0ABR0T1Q4_9HYPO
MPVGQLVLPWVLQLVRQKLNDTLNELVESNEILLDPKTSFEVDKDLNIKLVAAENSPEYESESEFEPGTSTVGSATPDTIVTQPEGMIVQMVSDYPDDWRMILSLLNFHQNKGVHSDWQALRTELLNLPRNNNGPPDISIQDLIERLENCRTKVYDDIFGAYKCRDFLDSPDATSTLKFIENTEDHGPSLLRLSGFPVPDWMVVEEIMQCFSGYDKNPALGPLGSVIGFLDMTQQILVDEPQSAPMIKSVKSFLRRAIAEGNWEDRNSFMDGMMWKLRELLK